MDDFRLVALDDSRMECQVKLFLVHRILNFYSLSNESPKVLGNQSQMLKMKLDLNSSHLVIFCHLKNFFNLELQSH